MGYDGRVRGWGHQLQDSGIPVESIGKLHYRRDEDPTGFDRQHNVMQIWEGIGQVWGSNRRPFEKVMHQGMGALKSDGRRQKLFKKIGPGESGYNRYDKSIADLTIEWLKDRTAGSAGDSSPWVLYVGFVAPHLPLVVPQEFYDLYPLDKLPLPKLRPQDGHSLHPWHFPQVFKDREFVSDDQRRIAIAAYLGLCSYLDYQIGRVLNALEEYGFSDHTRVVYTSDHGENLGARGLWGKTCLYQESTAVPLILAGPDIPAGRVVNTPVDFTDYQPTILEAVGLNPNACKIRSRGRSLFKILSEPYDDKRIAFSEFHAFGSPTGAFMLRRGRYKYHYYVGFEPELFDLDSDPEETRNLAPDPEYKDLLKDFEAELRKVCDPETVDQRAKEDQDALIEKFGGAEKARLIGTPGATPVPGGTHE
jgi:choline-sulfatase